MTMMNVSLRVWYGTYCSTKDGEKLTPCFLLSSKSLFLTLVRKNVLQSTAPSSSSTLTEGLFGATCQPTSSLGA